MTGVRFYKGAGNTGSHIGSLWSSTGTLLGRVTFTGETATGWQQASFAAPIVITPGTTYVVSYFAPNGHYAVELDYFALSGFARTPLLALDNSTPGGTASTGTARVRRSRSIRTARATTRSTSCSSRPEPDSGDRQR